MSWPTHALSSLRRGTSRRSSRSSWTSRSGPSRWLMKPALAGTWGSWRNRTGGNRMLPTDGRLTGAEAIARVLSDSGTSIAFAYAGTSELALCEAIDRIDGVRLVNGRGDKESAFMAAGANLLSPGRGVAILHGARGLTNAAGGI